MSFQSNVIQVKPVARLAMLLVCGPGHVAALTMEPRNSCAVKSMMFLAGLACGAWGGKGGSQFHAIPHATRWPCGLRALFVGCGGSGVSFLGFAFACIARLGKRAQPPAQLGKLGRARTCWVPSWLRFCVSQGLSFSFFLPVWLRRRAPTARTFFYLFLSRRRGRCFSFFVVGCRTCRELLWQRAQDREKKKPAGGPGANL